MDGKDRLYSNSGTAFEILQSKALEEWLGTDDKKSCKSKTFYEDITEGKFSYPVIHAMKTPNGDEVLNILRKRTEDVALKRYCVSLLEKAGSMQYTRDKLDKLDREIRIELDRLGGNPLMTEILNELSSWKAKGKHIR